MVRVILAILTCIQIYAANEHLLQNSNSYYVTKNRQNINFFTEDNVSSILFIKAIKQSLNNCGARITAVNEFSNKNPLIYSVLIWYDKNFTINKLKKELTVSGFQINTSFSKHDTISFKLNKTPNLTIKPNLVIKNTDIHLDKVKSNYLIDIKNTDFLTISTKDNNEWFAHIRFYDKNLKQISIKKSQDKKISYEIDLSDMNASFILINDHINKDNIKHGLILNFK